MIEFALEVQDITPFLDEAKLAMFADSLPPLRRERILTPNKLVDRARRAAAEMALKRALKTFDIPYRSVEIDYHESGKPYVKSQTNLRVSFSHAGALSCVLLVKTDSPVEVGVDIESMRETPRHAALAERFFSPEMLASYLSVPEDERERTFLFLWTKLEALAKMDGEGVGKHIGKVCFPSSVFTTSYTTVDAAGTPYIISVCASQNIFPENTSFPPYSLAIAKAICYNSGVNTRKEY